MLLLLLCWWWFPTTARKRALVYSFQGSTFCFNSVWCCYSVGQTLNPGQKLHQSMLGIVLKRRSFAGICSDISVCRNEFTYGKSKLHWKLSGDGFPTLSATAIDWHWNWHLKEICCTHTHTPKCTHLASCIKDAQKEKYSDSLVCHCCTTMPMRKLQHSVSIRSCKY